MIYYSGVPIEHMVLDAAGAFINKPDAGPQTAFEKIEEGLKEALEIARGNAKPAESFPFLSASGRPLDPAARPDWSLPRVEGWPTPADEGAHFSKSVLR